MKQQISVTQAIRHGHFMVNVPVILVLIGIPLLSYYLVKQNGTPEWTIVVGCIFGFIAAWLIWAVMITKWRIWAFDNVRNVHELKRRAIAEKLIWNDGNIFGRTEIRTVAEKQQLAKFEKKFEQPDLFREDYSLPKRTKIYYSAYNTYFEIGFSIFLICFGCYFVTLLDNKSMALGAISMSTGIYYLFKASKRSKNKEPQIIIDSDGIETRSTEFISWDLIYDEEVIQEGYGNSASTYFQYYFDDGEIEKIYIDDLNTSHRKLENIVRTYRVRFDKNNR